MWFLRSECVERVPVLAGRDGEVGVGVGPDAAELGQLVDDDEGGAPRHRRRHAQRVHKQNLGKSKNIKQEFI